MKERIDNLSTIVDNSMQRTARPNKASLCHWMHAIRSQYTLWQLVTLVTLITHTHTQPFNGRWSGTTRVGRYQKKHSPTHTHPDHRTSFINFLLLLRYIASSVFSLRAWQSSLSTSFQVLLVLDRLLHTPCISSPDHHLLYAAHAHTKAACSAVIPMLRHLYLVTLKQLQNTEAYIYNKSAFRYLRTLTTWHCPHSHTAAVATDQYILHAGPTAANLQQQGACGQCQVCCCGSMLGQTYG